MTQPIVFEYLRLDVVGMNEDHIAELVKAKSMMWDGTDATKQEEEYLCFQLRRQESKAAKLLEYRLLDALSPSISFEGAVAEHIDPMTMQQCQIQKMLWIDQMILDIKEQA